MSLILDALKRSRGDASEVPGVDTYHTLEDLRPAWQRFLPWIALVVAVVLIACLVLERAGLLPGEKATGAQEERVSAAPVESSPAPAPVPAPAVKPAPRVESAPAVNPVAAVAARPSASVAQQRQSASAALEEPEQAVDTAVADLYRARQREAVEEGGSTPQPAASPAQRQQPEASARSAESEQPIDIEQILQQARGEMERGEFVDHPAKFISSLSQQVKNTIPTILYQRHDYSGQTGRASVVMNGKTLRVGGSPAPGVKLDEILPNSAVLSYRGTQFRLRALNSWVNL